MNAIRILVIDDDQDICLLLSRFLTKKGHSVDTTYRGSTARELLGKGRYDVVLCDYRLPDTDGGDMVRFIRDNAPATRTIVITGYSDVRLAVELMRQGAFDYVAKPLLPDEILMRIEEAYQSGQDHHGNGTVPNTAGKRPSAQSGTSAQDFVEGTGPYADHLKKHLDLVAPTDMTVLIMGETGTGKEYVAKRIHARSARSNKPFVAIDCGALPKDLAGSELFGHVKGSFTGAVADKRGSFEQAEGGTLFLDEVGNLSYENQVKLLRVLQERRIKRVGADKDIAVDVRVLAATNEDLHKAVTEGRFREDLMHRINEFSLQLFPLRQRREDIPAFAEHFLQGANQRLGRNVLGFEPAVLDRLIAHAWSGNLRELNNVIKRAVLLTTGERVQMSALPAEVISERSMAPAPAAGAHTFAEEDDGLRGVARTAEKDAILKALERNGFNKSRTADMLNIDRKTLYNKLKLLGIEL
ncbi:MAG: sigma-54-dependent Fis family transcriptional regulator [Flavobacteriales bacterium]|nr:sigma-54-dependent Fis family transcriptional regulator [Flavobacteriales bacterium]